MTTGVSFKTNVVLNQMKTLQGLLSVPWWADRVGGREGRRWGWEWKYNYNDGKGDDGDDDGDGDDDDLYIMVKCVCVCHEKVTKFVWPPPHYFQIFF